MTKKIIVLILLLIFPLALAGCDANTKTYKCYEHIEYAKNIGEEEFSRLDYTKDFKTYTLSINKKDKTFKIERVNTTKQKETYTGTFKETENSYIFSYDDALHQAIESYAGKEEYIKVGKELHLNQIRNIETATKVLGNKEVKFK